MASVSQRQSQPRPEDEHTRRPPRLGHLKSKTGCLRCKARKVKCDEERPICAGCRRHDVVCEYPTEPRLTADPVSVPAKINDGRRHLPPPIRSMDNPPQQLADIESRNIIELRLMHHFTTFTAHTLPGADNPDVLRTWSTDVPPFALQHPALLHAIFAFAALHLSKVQPEVKHWSIYRCYFTHALRAHNYNISNLSVANADAVCLSCILISVLSFVPELCIRDQATGEPSIGPSLYQTLLVSRGSGDVFRKAWDWMKDEPTSFARVIVKASPQYLEAYGPQSPLKQDPSDGRLVWPEKYAEMFKGLLDPELPHSVNSTPSPSHTVEIESGVRHGETWTPSLERIYTEALSSLSSLYLHAQCGDPPLSLCRRLMGYSAMLSMDFLHLVRQGRPRALAVLSCFFALSKLVGDVWWIGDTGRRVVLAIYHEIPEDLRMVMQWPLQMVDAVEAEPDDIIAD